MKIMRLPVAVRRDLEVMTRRGYPKETCGLLIGKRSESLVVVYQAVEARNLSSARVHDRYEVDPHDFLVADRQASADGLDIVGIWHSHPDHPAQPSETDRAAAWKGWSYVIASITRKGMAGLRSWRLDSNNRFQEEVIQKWVP